MTIGSFFGVGVASLLVCAVLALSTTGVLHSCGVGAAVIAVLDFWNILPRLPPPSALVFSSAGLPCIVGVGAAGLGCGVVEGVVGC